MIDQSDLTIVEVAAMTKLSPKTIRRYVKGGTLPAYQIGRKAMFRIKLEDVTRFLTITPRP